MGLPLLQARKKKSLPAWKTENRFQIPYSIHDGSWGSRTLGREDLDDSKDTYEDNGSESQSYLDDVERKVGLMSQSFKLWKPPHQKILSTKYYLIIETTYGEKIFFSNQTIRS